MGSVRSFPSNLARQNRQYILTLWVRKLIFSYKYYVKGLKLAETGLNLLMPCAWKVQFRILLTSANFVAPLGYIV